MATPTNLDHVTAEFQGKTTQRSCPPHPSLKKMAHSHTQTTPQPTTPPTIAIAVISVAKHDERGTHPQAFRKTTLPVFIVFGRQHANPACLPAYLPASPRPPETPPITGLCSFETTAWPAIFWRWQRWQRRHATAAAAAAVVASPRPGHPHLRRQLRLLLQGLRWRPTRVTQTGVRSRGFLRTPCTTSGCARSIPGRAARSARRLRYVCKRDIRRQTGRQAGRQTGQKEGVGKAKQPIFNFQIYYYNKNHSTNVWLEFVVCLLCRARCLVGASPPCFVRQKWLYYGRTEHLESTGPEWDRFVVENARHWHQKDSSLHLLSSNIRNRRWLMTPLCRPHTSAIHQPVKVG